MNVFSYFNKFTYYKKQIRITKTYKYGILGQFQVAVMSKAVERDRNGSNMTYTLTTKS